MFEIDHDKLSNFVETTKKLIELKPQMNESNTKTKVIVPLLELLGWDKRFDIELEYPVRVGSTTAKVDYALSIEGRPTVLVEAKGFDSELNDGFARQAISYGRYEDVKWAALTNGKTIHIYDTTLGRGPKECLIDKIDIDDFVEKKTTLCLLSKDSIKNKETDSIVERIRKKQDYINDLNENKEEYATKITNILKKSADKELYNRIREISEGVIENIIKEFTKTSDDVRVEKGTPTAKPIKEESGEIKLTKTKRLQLDFWNGFKQYALSNDTELRLRKTRPQHWYDISAGSSLANISLQINTRENEIQCLLYIPDCKDLYNYLEKNKEEIERELNIRLEWFYLENAKASVIQAAKKVDTRNKDNWDEYFKWLHDKAIDFRHVFLKYMKNFRE